jgi:hypothetical protein
VGVAFPLVESFLQTCDTFGIGQARYVRRMLDVCF